jgi:hypothetical protein
LLCSLALLSLVLLAVLRFVLLCFALGCGASCFVVVASLLVCIGFALAGFLLRFALLLLVCGVCFLLLLVASCFVLCCCFASCCFLLCLVVCGASLRWLASCFLLLASCFLLLASCLASLRWLASLCASNFGLVCGSCWALSIRYLCCLTCAVALLVLLDGLACVECA